MYVDGFLIPVASHRLDEYKQMAADAAIVWKEYGALDYVETVGDDMQIDGVDSFLNKAGCNANEVVVFSWISYRDKAHRDAVNEKVMADPRLQQMMDQKDPVFDCRRMAYGGFRLLVKA
ncbi:DUF1428 domain-containing protein [Rheinheimera sp.]|uniref:DUF1428 domain-containing protein n=1 Tax=Rheinheimera sp. TaxID=1869214 RepID=UPI003AF79F43